MSEPVPPLEHLFERADAYFLRHLGIGFEALAAPLEPANPAGLPARATTVYRAIIEARQGDDVAAPRGVWQRQPKRSDWPHVSTLAAGALRTQGKDLQLAAWLCEAQVHEHGYPALAPCLLLLHTLCERYWHALHPQPENGDVEARPNIIRWLDEKLRATVHQAQTPAHVNEDGGARMDAKQAAPADLLTEHVTSLTDALSAIALTQGTLDSRLANAAPRLDLLAAQLRDILTVLHPPVDDHPPAPETPHPAAPHQFRNRADAYACLAAAAAYLTEVEPHSPTPYLVKRAVEWGNMNTGALYQELFIRLGGQLSIFDMVGSTPTQLGSE